MQTLFSTNTCQVGTILSDCRLYRYVLERVWDDCLPSIAFVGLNPSTADETIDDNTIRECTYFAKQFGFGRLFMLNLFAFRATHPTTMMRVDEPIGKDNNKWLVSVSKQADKVVLCYGIDGIYQGRDYQVIRLLVGNSLNLYCFGVNKNKTPKHPLYLKGDSILYDFNDYVNSSAYLI